MTQGTTDTSGNSHSPQDRQRERAARGIRTRDGASVQRPSPPRRRRPALAALSVLLIVGGAALAGLLALRLDSRDPVLALNQDVPVGVRIEAGMLTTTDVASDQLMLVPEGQAATVIGTYARLPLTKGQLLDTSMLVASAPFASNAVRVGVPLKPGQVPSGLRSGDQVRVIRIGDGSTPVQALAVGLLVSAGTNVAGGSLSGDADASIATLLVPAATADVVVDAAGRDLLGLALIKRGVTADDAGLQTLGSAR